MIEKPLTKTQLRKEVGCPGFIIDYLRDCNRLPIVKESTGRGHSTLYDPEAIDIVKAHLAKQSR